MHIRWINNIKHRRFVTHIAIAEQRPKLKNVYLNEVATAVPPYDIHQRFAEFAPTQIKEKRKAAIFKRMAGRSQIEHRYSFLKADTASKYLDNAGFYKRGNFPDTMERMRFYEDTAFTLARQALNKLDLTCVNADVTHLIVTSCTGFYAPGLDLQIVSHYGLGTGTERTMIGFMGCYAAFNAMKLAWHIVRSEPQAKVLIVNLELCTLHLQETDNIEELLSYLVFADGCAASIVSAKPQGLRLDSFQSKVVPESKAQITWTIGNDGFDMVLSGKVPGTIGLALPELQSTILNGQKPDDIRYWAIHPGGRTVLDAVQKSFGLSDVAMAHSREVLRAFGNMSSATVMFVLRDILASNAQAGSGCSMAFGPGVTLETMLFHKMVA